MTGALVLLAACLLCATGYGVFRDGTAWLERRDIRRFEQRAELLRLRAATLKAEDVELLKQRLARLELKGLAR